MPTQLIYSFDPAAQPANTALGAVGNGFTDVGTAWLLSNATFEAGLYVPTGRVLYGLTDGTYPANPLLRPRPPGNNGGAYETFGGGPYTVKNHANIITFRLLNSSSCAPHFPIRYNPNTGAGYYCSFAPLGPQAGTIQLVSKPSTAGAQTILPGSQKTFAYGGGVADDLIVLLPAYSDQANPGNGTILFYKLVAKSNPAIVLASFTSPLNTLAGVQLNDDWATGLGSGGFDNLHLPVIRYELWEYDGATLPSLTSNPVVARPALNAFDENGVTFKGTAPTGGTAPYTHQAVRATDPTGAVTVLGAASVDGSGNPSYTDLTGTAGTVYFYGIRTTDNAARVTTGRLINGSKLEDPPVVFGVIGDSTHAIKPTDMWKIGYDHAPADYCADIIRVAKGKTRRVVVVNQAQSGSASADWLPTSGTGYLTNTKAAFAAAGLLWAFFEIGINDAGPTYNVPATTLYNQCVTILQNLTGAGYNVILMYPNAGVLGSASDGGWTEDKASLMTQYLAKFDLLGANSASLFGGKVYGPYKTPYSVMSNNPAYTWYTTPAGIKLISTPIATPAGINFLGTGNIDPAYNGLPWPQLAGTVFTIKVDNEFITVNPNQITNQWSLIQRGRPDPSIPGAPVTTPATHLQGALMSLAADGVDATHMLAQGARMLGGVMADALLPLVGLGSGGGSTVTVRRPRLARSR